MKKCNFCFCFLGKRRKKCWVCDWSSYVCPSDLSASCGVSPGWGSCGGTRRPRREETPHHNGAARTAASASCGVSTGWGTGGAPRRPRREETPHRNGATPSGASANCGPSSGLRNLCTTPRTRAEEITHLDAATEWLDMDVRARPLRDAWHTNDLCSCRPTQK